MAVNEEGARTPGVNTPQPAAAIKPTTSLPFDEEAKLVYGVVLSLRNMIKKLSGRYVAPLLSLLGVSNLNTETSNL